MIVTLILFLAFAPGAQAKEYHDVFLPEGEHDHYNLSTILVESTTIDVTVTNGGPIDVYIMTNSDYNNRYPSGNFHPEIQKQNRTNIHIVWDGREGGNYVLVIDNLNNSQENDTVPEGAVDYDLDLDQKIDEDLRDLVEKFMFLCCGILLVIVILVVLVLYFIFREKPPQQIQPSYMAAPNSPAYAQSYQPPPQGHYPPPPQQEDDGGYYEQYEQ